MGHWAWDLAHLEFIRLAHRLGLLGGPPKLLLGRGPFGLGSGPSDTYLVLVDRLGLLSGPLGKLKQQLL